LNRRQVLRRFNVEAEWMVWAARFLPDGQRVTFSTLNATLAVWDIAPSELQHSAQIGCCQSAIALLPDDRIASADADGLVSIAVQANVRSWADWVFVAMALYRQRLTGDEDALARAKSSADKVTHNWGNQIQTTHLLDEATRELKLPPPR
jgi:hypothetical protein